MSTSAPSPPPVGSIRQPSLSTKPLAPASSPDPLTPTSVTAKEWVIPPRPKPGRKPAIDTPPTKRKAQNRAAQRAFRERRAARVGELEDHIKVIEAEDEREQTELREQIANLSVELERCQEHVEWWKERCSALEREVATERNAKETLMRERGSDTVVVPRTSRISAGNQVNDSHPPIGPALDETEADDEPMGCGNCSPMTRCKCIDEALDMSNITNPEDHISSNPKRPQSPQQPPHTKRVRSIKPDPEELEIDFTSRFSNPANQSTATATKSVSPISAIADPCGFCQNGTPCICAEMAAGDNNDTATIAATVVENSRTAPITHLAPFTPPPSDGDVRPEVSQKPGPASSQTSISNTCTDGPGTCAQCRSDPNSTFFCKSLAASRQAPSSSSERCCGASTNGSCCQTRSSHQTATSTQGITLTCADAYTTLSRHPKFSQATNELGTWMPKLQTLPSPRSALAPEMQDVQSLAGRPTFEVEAASVMGVLKYFDRRFGDNGPGNGQK